jgi:Uri superfamily endonuclease
VTKVGRGITPLKNGLGNEGKGSYVLLIELPEEQTITIGSLKAVHFHPGYYAYVGSALGGFKSRLNRHLKEDKRPHWHIDYLLPKASITDIIINETEDRVECALAQALKSQFDSIPGFGSSDCKCHSHLFLAADEMKTTILATINQLGYETKTGKVL